MEPNPPRTVSEGLKGVSLADAIAYLGFLIAVIGSIAPWATTPLSSASGFDGDGKWTAAAAVLGCVVLAARPLSSLAPLFALAIVGIGIYDAIHIHRRLEHLTLFGTQVDHVGWGVYVVIVGGAIAAAAAVESYANFLGTQPPGTI